jgi:hypothetical protein
MQALRAGVVYFLLVYAAGFIWGLFESSGWFRVLDEEMRNLLEEPIMAVGIVLAARWIVRRLRVPSTTSKCPGIGLVALALLITPERGVALGL